MYSEKRLAKEIDNVIEEQLAKNGSVSAAWAAQIILKSHTSVDHIDEGFFTLCTAKSVREYVRRSVSKFDPKASGETDTEVLLPGFDRLQRVYMIVRGGEQVAVKVDRCTDLELNSKRLEILGMSKGLMEHADEIARYIDDRTGRAVG